MTTDWLQRCIADAKKSHAAVPQAAVDAVTQMLSGPAADKEMKPAELKAEASRLLAAMVELPKKVGK
jgi:hypothetical protein